MSSLPTVFLDSHEGLLSSEVAFSIVLLTAGALVIGLVFNAISLRNETIARREETDAKKLQIVKDFFNDFIEQDKSEPKDKNQKDWLKYATGYLDILDSIAYLDNEKLIPRNLTAVFYGHFRYGVQL